MKNGDFYKMPIRLIDLITSDRLQKLSPKGNELKTTAYSVADDLYKRYGLSKLNVYPASAKKSKNITLIIDGIAYLRTPGEKWQFKTKY